MLNILSTGSKTKHIAQIKFDEVNAKGYTFYSFIDPNSIISPSAKIGENCIICNGSIIEPETIIENGVFIRSAVYISHETQIGAFTYLAPRAALSGNIKVGKHCFIGTNATRNDTSLMFIPPPYNSKIFFYKLDINFNVINQKIINYKQDRWLSKIRFVIDSDTNILITGSDAEYSYGMLPIQDPFIYKISENGDSIKCVTYNNAYRGSCDDILEKADKSGYYAFINGFVYSYVISADKILELNKNLDSLSCRPIPNNITQNFSSIYLNDSVFIISGDKTGNYHNIRVQTVNINSTGNNFIDYASYGGDTVGVYNLVPYMRSISKKNSNIYLSGEVRHQLSGPVYNGADSTFYYIIKLNQDLTAKWEKRIGGDAMYALFDICATNDGGCLMVGTRHNHTIQTTDEVDIYVVKISSNGSTNWAKKIIIDNKINIYPNPGTDLINISSDTDYSNFYLYDMFGKIVISENTKCKTINTSNLQNGIYIYRITNIKGEVLKTGKWVKQ